MNDLATRLLAIAGANAVIATLLGVAAWYLMRRREHRIAHVFCVLALVKLVTPPLVQVPLMPAPDAPIEVQSELDPAAQAASASELDAVTLERPAQDSLQSAWPEVVVGLLLLGSALLFVRAARFSTRFRQLLRGARRAPPAMSARAAELATRMGLARCPELLLVDARISPMLCVVDRGVRIILPQRLLAAATPAQVDTLLAHELAHASRRDHWVRPLELVATGTYWWLPTTWLLRRMLRAAEERACDEKVIAALPGEGRAYADALLTTLDFLASSRWTLPSTACGAGSFHDIKTRLTTIMSDSHTRPLPRFVRALLLMAAVAALALAPTRAQPSTSSDDSKSEGGCCKCDEAQHKRDIELKKLKAKEADPRRVRDPSDERDADMVRLEKRLVELAQQGQKPPREEKGGGAERRMKVDESGEDLVRLKKHLLELQQHGKPIEQLRLDDAMKKHLLELKASHELLDAEHATLDADRARLDPTHADALEKKLIELHRVEALPEQMKHDDLEKRLVELKLRHDARDADALDADHDKLLKKRLLELHELPRLPEQKMKMDDLKKRLMELKLQHDAMGADAVKLRSDHATLDLERVLQDHKRLLELDASLQSKEKRALDEKRAVEEKLKKAKKVKARPRIV